MTTVSHATVSPVSFDVLFTMLVLHSNAINFLSLLVNDHVWFQGIVMMMYLTY